MRRALRASLLVTSGAWPLLVLAAACSDEADPEPARRPDAAPVATVGPDGAALEGGALTDQITPPPLDGGTAWDFAPPYVATLGPSSRSDAGHNSKNNPKSNPADTKCLDCHSTTGSASNMPFFAGGTVRFQSNNAPAPSAEVRVKRTLNANAISAYTDQDGNWFIPLAAAQAANVNFSLRPGVRNASIVRMMGPSPAIGNCNQCHNGSQKL